MKRRQRIRKIQNLKKQINTLLLITMNGYIKESNRGGVYNRLFLDSTVRKKKQDTLSIQTLAKPDPTPKPRNKIENVLLQKHAKSQAKINTMRVKQQKKETEQLKSIPQINKISKQLTDIREGNLSESISLYTARILNASKSSGAKLPPKQSFLSLIDLDQGEKAILRQNWQLLKEEYDESILREQNSTRNPGYAVLKTTEKPSEKDLEIEELRQAVLARCNVMEHEEPPVELLKMSVLDRGTYWLNAKKNRLKQQEEIKLTQETLGCTFSPRLTPRLRTTQGLKKTAESVNTTYSAKHSYKVNRTASVQKKELQSPPSQTDNKMMLYKSLSPHERRLSQGQDSSLLLKARPMVSYRF